MNGCCCHAMAATTPRDKIHAAALDDDGSVAPFCFAFPRKSETYTDRRTHFYAGRWSERRRNDSSQQSVHVSRGTKDTALMRATHHDFQAGGPVNGSPGPALVL